MRNIVLKFGLMATGIFAFTMVITFLVIRSIPDDLGMVIGYTTMVLAFLMVYFGVRSYRDNVAGGSIRFGRAFKVGSLIMLIGVVGYVATWEVIYFGFIPDFAEKYATRTVEHARQSGRDSAHVAKVEKQMADFQVAYRNPFKNVAYTALEPLPVGLLLTLVSAFALSRPRRDPAAPDAS